jgi:hypothetical protein
MTTDNFCFYLLNRLKPVKQEVNGTVILPSLVFPAQTIQLRQEREREGVKGSLSRRRVRLIKSERSRFIWDG